VNDRKRAVCRVRSKSLQHNTYQTIIDTFLGLMIGIGIGTVVSRLIWPVLPQRVLKDNMLALCGQIKALLSGEPHREKIQTQLALFPVEALQAAGRPVVRSAFAGARSRRSLSRNCRCSG